MRKTQIKNIVEGTVARTQTNKHVIRDYPEGSDAGPLKGRSVGIRRGMVTSGVRDFSEIEHADVKPDVEEVIKEEIELHEEPVDL